MVVSNTLNARGYRSAFASKYDGNVSNLTVSFVRDLVKSTVLANLTPSSKRSCDVDSIHTTV